MNSRKVSQTETKDSHFSGLGSEITLHTKIIIPLRSFKDEGYLRYLSHKSFGFLILSNGRIMVKHGPVPPLKTCNSVS